MKIALDYGYSSYADRWKSNFVLCTYVISVKGTFQSEKNREISIFVPSTNRSNISLHTALLFEFSRTKINLKVSFLVVSMRKNTSRFEWLSNQRAKDCFELIFWNLEWLLTLFTLFLSYNNVGDFKFGTEEQKKVHLYVDMTNISPSSGKNVPLPHMRSDGMHCMKEGKPSLSKSGTLPVQIFFFVYFFLFIHFRTKTP